MIWQMKQPLRGKRILVTRPRHQAGETVRLIEDRGGEAVLFPCLQMECLSREIMAAAEQTGRASDILFTSANGVHCVAETLGDRLAELFTGKRIVAVGDKTAAALREHGLKADLIPATYSQQGLIELYRQHGMPESLLFFRAREGRDLLAAELAAAGCEVSMVFAYHSSCPTDDASATIADIKNGAIDAVLLGSPKTALNYLQRIGDATVANIPAIVVISPQVAETATAAGLGVQAVAKTASFDAMLDALASSYHS